MCGKPHFVDFRIVAHSDRVCRTLFAFKTTGFPICFINGDTRKRGGHRSVVGGVIPRQKAVSIVLAYFDRPIKPIHVTRFVRLIDVIRGVDDERG
jgi:hypothetical protein